MERKVAQGAEAQKGAAAADKPIAVERPMEVEPPPQADGEKGEGNVPAGLSEEEPFSDGALDRSQREDPYGGRPPEAFMDIDVLGELASFGVDVGVVQRRWENAKAGALRMELMGANL